MEPLLCRFRSIYGRHSRGNCVNLNSQDSNGSFATFRPSQTDLFNASARLLDHQLVHHGLEADAHHDGLGSHRETVSRSQRTDLFAKGTSSSNFFYLLAGDGDPLEAVLAHQVLKGQLQFHIALGRAGGVAGAVGHGDLLQETERVMPLLV